MILDIIPQNRSVQLLLVVKNNPRCLKRVLKILKAKGGKRGDKRKCEIGDGKKIKYIWFLMWSIEDARRPFMWKCLGRKLEMWFWLSSQRKTKI